MKRCYFDFEFHSASERDPVLVAACARVYSGPKLEFVRSFWLLHKPDKKAAKTFFEKLLREGYIFVSYNIEAEARCMYALLGNGHWEEDFKAIDLYLEYRNLLNHNHKYAYGKQYKDGRVITTTPPRGKWELRQAGDTDDHHKPSYSLAAAVFKLCNRLIDTVEKKEVVQLILTRDHDRINAQRDRILAYNMSDIVHLRELEGIFERLNRDAGFTAERWRAAAMLRAGYGIRTARMVRTGYPVNREKLDKFLANLPQFLKLATDDVMASTQEFQPFRRVKGKWVQNQKLTRQWVAAQGKPYWRKTKNGLLSLSHDAFKDWYDSESPGFPGAYCRYGKTKQSLNGFLPGGKSGHFLDYLGSDNRARPNFGIYGAQSSRSQPRATGFLPLKAKWMRNFIEAPPGRALCCVDYSSQEFLIAAILSQDKAMMSAYQSGDVYLAFAKAARLVPADATAATHKAERDRCKTLVLGISYDMGPKGLAGRLGCTEKEAEQMVDAFFRVYPDYAEWKADILTEYEQTDSISLSDGWTMWGDNHNRRSVGNMPVQGEGAVIMREAVARAQEAGLDVILTLHDSLYIEFNSSEHVEKITTLMNCMARAFRSVMRRNGHTVDVRLEGEAWSVDWANPPENAVTGVNYSKEYVDKKGAKDLARYRPYFT